MTISTNYYAQIIPTKERKERLKNLIDLNDFSIIQDEINTTYGRYTINSLGESSGGRVHLGKRSGGWKFLWNPNVYVIHNGHSEKIGNSYTWINGPSELYYTYPLTRAGLKSFIDRPDVQIYDEYGRLENKDEFWDMALNWTTWNDQEAWDSRSYTAYERAKNPNYRVYPIKGELIDMLRNEGIEFTSECCSDFYSDGLRFASYTDFS